MAIHGRMMLQYSSPTVVWEIWTEKKRSKKPQSEIIIKKRRTLCKIREKKNPELLESYGESRESHEKNGFTLLLKTKIC